MFLFLSFTRAQHIRNPVITEKYSFLFKKLWVQEKARLGMTYRAPRAGLKPKRIIGPDRIYIYANKWSKV